MQKTWLMNVQGTRLTDQDLYPDVCLEECPAGYSYKVASMAPDRKSGFEATLWKNGTKDILIRIGPSYMANVHSLQGHVNAPGYGIRWVDPIRDDQHWEDLCRKNEETATIGMNP